MDQRKILVDLSRISRRIKELSQIGALPGGGVCRLTLTDEDKAARDWLKGQMEALGLDVIVDELGNLFGIRAGRQDVPPVMVGSHLDTVGTGGLYDGSLGFSKRKEYTRMEDVERGVETLLAVFLALSCR